MSFEAKYLKYKKKYLELKYLIEHLEENKNNSITQKGGGLPCIFYVTERCKKKREEKRALKRSVNNPVYNIAEEALRKAKEKSKDGQRRMPNVPRSPNPLYDQSFDNAREVSTDGQRRIPKVPRATNPIYDHSFDPEKEIYGIPGKREGFRTLGEAYAANPQKIDPIKAKELEKKLNKPTSPLRPEVPLAFNPIYETSFDPEKEIFGIPGERGGYPTKGEAYAANEQKRKRPPPYVLSPRF